MRLSKSVVAVIACLLVLALSSPAVYAKPSVDYKGGKVTIDTDEIARWLDRDDDDDNDDDDEDREWAQSSLNKNPLFGLFSRFFGALKFRIAYGTVTEVRTSKGQPSITIKNSDNKLETYTAGNGVKVWLNGKQARLNDLDAGDRVAMLLNPSGHVLTIAANSDDQTTPVPPTTTQSGTVTQILNQNSLRAVTIRANGNLNTYLLTTDAKVTFKNWAAGSFVDIREGDQVTFKLVDGKISELIVETAVASDVGQVTAISSTAISIKRENGTTKSYPFGQNMSLTIAGITDPEISDVLVGDRAELLLRDGIVRSIRVTPATNISGTISSVGQTNDYRYVRIKKSNNEIVTYRLTSAAQVSFTNWPAGTFADIREGDTVRARLVDGKITNLIVETVTSSDAGQITAISTTAISIKRDNGTTKSYPFGQNMSLTIDGITDPKISDVLVGDRADLLLRDGIVRSMHVAPATNLTGTVQSVGTSGDYRYISIKKSNSVIETYILTANTTVGFTNWPAGTFADIREGDTVRARLVDGKITNLIIETVTSSDAGQITAISATAISIKRGDDTTRAYPFGQNMSLTIQGVSAPTLSEVRVGDVANLLLRDGIVRAMHVVPANLVNGTVQSTIKVGDYRGVIIEKADGALVTYEFAANGKVSFKNLLTATFDDIRVGDLVSIRLAEGKVTELVIESVATSDRGTITAISTSSVTVRRDNNTTQSYTLGQNMTLTITGVTQPKLSDVLVGDQAELGLRDGKVFSMNVTPATAVSGKIEAIINNSTTRALTIKKADDQVVTHTLATNATVVIKDQPTATFASLLVGDTVSARIVDDKIVRLEAEYTYTKVEGSVTLTDLVSNPKKIYLLPTNGSASQTYTLATPCPVTIPGITSPTLSQIKVGDRAELTLRGGLVRSITVNPQLSIFNAVFVRVIGSSTAPGIEVIRDGNVVSYTLASSYTIVVPGKTNPTLSDVAAGKTVKITIENNLVKKLEVL